MHDKDQIQFLERIFDNLGDIVFCVKDFDGSYLAVNHTFVQRAGANQKTDVIGKFAKDVFPVQLTTVYEEQDKEVFSTGRPLLDQLEQITNTDGSVGWYLASKYPLLDSDKMVVGLVGISQDLHTPTDSELELSNLATVIDFIRKNLDKSLRVEPLADMAELSPEQLDRRMKKVYRLTTKKFIMKCRLEKGSRLLSESQMSLSQVATECGFSDQSAFTRQFRTAFHVTPAAYRQKTRKNPEEQNQIPSSFYRPS